MSFVIHKFPVPKAVSLAVHHELQSLGAEQRRFVLHVLASNILNLNKIHDHGLQGYLDLAIELPFQWIHEHFGREFDATAIDPSVLTLARYSTVAHRCRAFRASDRLLGLMLNGLSGDLAAVVTEPVVNLFDGEPYQVQVPAQWEHGIYSPKVIRDAVRAIDACPFNLASLERHLAELKERFEGSSGDDRDHLERVLRNDRACALRVLAGCVVQNTGVMTYEPEYRTSYTGRVVEVGGGAQSCSRAMKAAIFRNIPDLRNHDLKRAQAFILLQELEDAGLPRDWVEAYVHDPDANERRSAALGISKDVYKKCLYATIMGSPHRKVYDREKNKIFAVMLEEVRGDRRRAKELTQDVYGAFRSLKVEVEAWHQHLMTSPKCLHVDPRWASVRTLKNACGQHFQLKDERTDVLARQAAAFILQGQEAAFIHRLTVLGESYGFVPVNNQHDGLVFIGSVPQAAIEQAANSSNLRYAFLDEKPFL